MLNYDIINNSEDRKPGIVTGVVCGILFFFSLSDDLMLLLPRSGVCMFDRFIDTRLGRIGGFFAAFSLLVWLRK